LRIGTEEAWIMMQRVAREEGILAGVSGGAALVAARQIAASIDEGFVVVIIPDSGERYLSDPMIGEEESDAAARRFGGRQPASA
jgi:cysteine synthase